MTKAEVERQLKHCMVYERRAEDRQRVKAASRFCAFGAELNQIFKLNQILKLIEYMLYLRMRNKAFEFVFLGCFRCTQRSARRAIVQTCMICDFAG